MQTFKKNKILLTSVGGYFGKKNIEFLKSTNNNQTWVLAADILVNKDAQQIADQFVQVPAGNSKDYFPFIKNLIKKYNINFILPCSDEEAIELSKYKKQLYSMGVSVACQEKKINDIITNKYKTYELLKKNKMKFSQYRIVYNDQELIDCVKTFYNHYEEFVIKSPEARGNRGVIVVSKAFKGCKRYNGSRELHMSFKYFRLNFKTIIGKIFPKLVCERLFEPCFDLDVLCNNGKFFYAIPRKRINPAGVPFRGNIIKRSYHLQHLAMKACNIFNLSWLIDIERLLY